MRLPSIRVADKDPCLLAKGCRHDFLKSERAACVVEITAKGSVQALTARTRSRRNRFCVAMSFAEQALSVLSGNQAAKGRVYRELSRWGWREGACGGSGTKKNLGVSATTSGLDLEDKAPPFAPHCDRVAVSCRSCLVRVRVLSKPLCQGTSRYSLAG